MRSAIARLCSIAAVVVGVLAPSPARATVATCPKVCSYSKCDAMCDTGLGYNITCREYGSYKTCPLDYDGDGWNFGSNNLDNCPEVYNADQEDLDGDLVGDVCDNCPIVANEDQADNNNNGRGDVCESWWDRARWNDHLNESIPMDAYFSHGILYTAEGASYFDPTDVGVTTVSVMDIALPGNPLTFVSLAYVVPNGAPFIVGVDANGADGWSIDFDAALVPSGSELVIQGERAVPDDEGMSELRYVVHAGP